jgi:hypothetical protein
MEGGAQALVADVPFDHLGDRRLEQRLDRLLVAAEAFLQLGAAGRIPEPGVARRVAQGAADAAEQLLIGEVAVHVARVEGGDRGGGLLVVGPAGEAGAVLERAPQVGVGRRHPVAVALQFQLLDDQRVQQPDHVGARAHQPGGVGEGLLERAGAAEPVAALQHHHGPAGAGEIGGRGEPVVPAADDHRVPAPGGEVGRCHRQPDLAESVLDAHLALLSPAAGPARPPRPLLPRRVPGGMAAAQRRSGAA